MASLVFKDKAAQWEELRRSADARRARFDNERGLIELEERVTSPWWVYALLAARDDRVVLVEVRIFPSVERDRVFEIRNEVFRRLFRSRPRVITPSDQQRLSYAKRLVPKWGEWRRTKANLALQGAGLPGTVLERISPARLLAVAQSESEFMVKRFGTSMASAFDVIRSGPITPGRGPKSDLYYARLAAEYVSILTSGGPDARRPLVVMAERRGWGGKRGRDRVRDEIKECRNRHLLGGGGIHTGRAAGTLTARGRMILQEGEGK